MQKFRACKKRASLIQRRCSTSSRCNREICPAGPPKPIKPSLSHRRNACQKVTVAGASTGSSMGNVIAVLVISWSFDLRFVFKSSKQAVKDTTGCDEKLIVVGKGLALRSEGRWVGEEWVGTGKS